MVRLVGLVGAFEPQAEPAARAAARTMGAVRLSRKPGTAVEPIQLTCHSVVGTFATYALRNGNLALFKFEV
jgi:hypothetical protein